MTKIIDHTVVRLGDVRVLKRGNKTYVQEFVPGGWEYFQLAPNQTLSSVIAELTGRGFTYRGREAEDTVYYYRRPTTATDLTRDDQLREVLGNIASLYRSGVLSDMDVFHLLNGNPTTGEE